MKPGYVYLVRAGGRHKIGMTRNLKSRMYSLSRELGTDFEVLHTFPVADPRQSEKEWHQRFADRRIKGEYFDLGPEELALFVSQTGDPVTPVPAKQVVARLSDDGLYIINRLRRRYGFGTPQAIEFALRRMADAEGIDYSRYGHD